MTGRDGRLEDALIPKLAATLRRTADLTTVRTVAEKRLDKLRSWAGAIKRDVVALWLAAQDPRVPWRARVLAGAVAAYALSPVDLIPDFVPVLGYLDDLVIVPLGIWLAVKLIPETVMAELRVQAAGRQRPASRIGLAVVLIAWLAGIALSAWALW